ncbi:2-iminobutanoate/2-iminopropanoate deaminase [Dokdonia sp. Hel_I_63]|uniref:RidA family protein n=1 Tax=Dokdonia sp. Hel_I_63 TaxID=1249996 RepID=UPI00119A6C6D|nr:Rid family detoxifying hydrolase [Dokdonia sp. Hel_I_63]TVZ23201.1 2-iminobutanoate/2-iminopropanoate deaminase [Dokdonia sp. Hel_I_63]
MKRLSLFAACLLLFLSCQERHSLTRPALETKVEINEKPVFHKSHEITKKDAPFSDVVQVGEMYFLSGQIGLNQKNRTLVPGGITAETTQTLENIKEVLAQHDMDMSNVVKALVILDDIKDFKAFTEVYSSYFPQKPARTTFAVEALALGAKIEIEVIAVKN